jgi:energy-coupling factor transporter ATP-binding protein EcfA2
MRKILDIHVADAGYRGAYYESVSVPCQDLDTGSPTHTVILGPNGTGKTTLLSLLFSLVEPDRNKFLATLARSTHEYQDYFGDRPAAILVHWSSSSKNDHGTVITGHIVCRRMVNGKTEFDRLFFMFEPGFEFGWKDLPFRGIATDGAWLRTRDEVRRWLHERMATQVGNFRWTDNHADWREWLHEARIDQGLIAAQVSFNKNEGGIDAFLSFRSQRDFTHRLFEMTMNETELDRTRLILVKTLDRVRDRPRLRRQAEQLDRLLAAFRPFADETVAMRAAEDGARESRRTALGVAQAVDVQTVVIEEAAGETREAEMKARDAGTRARERISVLRGDIAGMMVARAALRLATAERVVASTGTKLEAAKRKAAIAAAAVDRAEIQGDDGRLREVQALIDASDASLAPERKRVASIGVALKQAFSREEAERLKEAETEKVAEQRAEEEKGRHEKAAAAARGRTADAMGRTARAQERIEQIQRRRAALECDGILVPGETAQEAAERWADAVELASGRAEEAERRGQDLQRRASDARAEVVSTRRDAASRRDEASRTEAQAEQLSRRRHELANHSVVLNELREPEIDPDLPAVGDALEAHRARLDDTRRRHQIKGELLADDVARIEKGGLASIDALSLAVVDLLHRNGVPDALPYPGWLAEVCSDVESVRAVAGSDSARFMGVAVQTAASLSKAMEILAARAETLPVSRPLVVSLARMEATEVSRDRFVVTDDRPASYDKSAATEHKNLISKEIEDLQGAVNALGARDEAIGRVLVELATWRETGGAKEIARLAAESRRLRAEAEVLDRYAAQRDEDAGNFERQAEEAAGNAKRLRKEAERAGRHAAEAGRFAKEDESAIDKARADLEAAQRDKNKSEALEATLSGLIETARDEIRRANRACEAAERAARSLEERRAQVPRAEGEPDLLLLTEPVELLEPRYQAALAALETAERGKLGELVVKRDEIKEALERRSKTYAKLHGALPVAEVDAWIAGSDLAGRREKAQEAHEAARNAHADADAERKHAERTLGEERRAHPKADVSRHERFGDAELADGIEVAKRGVVAAEKEVEDAARRETLFANRAGDLERIIDRLRGIAKRAREVAGDELDPLPWDEVGDADLSDKAVSALATQHRQARTQAEQRRKEAWRFYEDIRTIATTEPFSTYERQLSMEIGANTFEATCGVSQALSDAIRQRKASVDHDLDRLDGDKEQCVKMLRNVVVEASGILMHASRILVPADVPRFGNNRVLRINKHAFPDEAGHRNVIDHYIDDLIESDTVPETGLQMAADLMDRMARMSSPDRGLGIEYLKPTEHGQIEYMPIDRPTGSGGETLTAALLIFLVIVGVRQVRGGIGGTSGTVLILDNPIGKANKTVLLTTQKALADRLGVQLIYTTGINDHNALAAFENLVQLRSGATRSGRVIVEAGRVKLRRQEVAE